MYNKLHGRSKKRGLKSKYMSVRNYVPEPWDGNVLELWDLDLPELWDGDVPEPWGDIGEIEGKR